MSTSRGGTKEQVANLLKSLLSIGVQPSDAIPTIKVLVESKVFSLDDVSKLPASGIPADVRKKICAKSNKEKKKRKDPDAGNSTASKKARKRVEIVIPPVTSHPDSVSINRSPVLILWAAVVAKKQYELEWDEALSLGGALASKISHAKGTTLGIYAPIQKQNDSGNDVDDVSPENVELLGESIRCIKTDIGLRGLSVDGNESDPAKTWKTLSKKFGDGLGYVCKEFHQAADDAIKHYGGLENTSHGFYVHVRPDIPQGAKGWGAYGKLEMSKVREHFCGKKVALKSDALGRAPNANP